jgi:hypothetical protein
MKGRYEAELSRVENKYAENVHSEHAAFLTRLQADTFQRKAEVRQRLAGVEEEYSTVKV